MMKSAQRGLLLLFSAWAAGCARPLTAVVAFAFLFFLNKHSFQWTSKKKKKKMPKMFRKEMCQHSA